jgi:outer membrane protein TolC
MKSFQSGIAVLCVLLLLAPFAAAQTPTVQPQVDMGGPFSGLIKPYQSKQVAPINLSNSNRLEQLLRAGIIYLSLQDAIALALENNLDIEIQRYTRPTAEAGLLRAEAGGLLRGVPTNIQNATTSALSQVGGGTGNFGGGGALSSSTSGNASTGGAIITQTGTAVPNLDPSMYFVANWGHSTSPQANSFNYGTTAVQYNYGSYNWGIQKGFTTGTNVSMNWQAQPVTSNAGRAQLNPSTASFLNLQFQQHLLQGFGLAVNTRNIQISKNNLRASDLVFKQQVISTVAAVIAAYWDLVSFNENVKVQQQAVALSQKLFDDNTKQVEIGTLAPIEVVRAESQLATNQQALVNAQTQVLQQETQIKNALSRTGIASPTIADARIVPIDRITVPDQEPIRPVQDLVSTALANRPELAQTRINIQNARIGLIGDKHQLLPALDLVGSFQNSGLAGALNAIPNPPAPPLTFVPTPHGPEDVDPFFLGGFGTSMAQIFRRNFPNYAIGLQLNIPLRNRTAQADMVTDQLSLRTAELQEQRLNNSIRADVRNGMIAVEQASAAYKAAVKARILAEQTLDAEQKKYELGASTVFFVIQYQRDLAQARSQEVLSESQYAKAKVQLDMALGTTLDTNHISMAEATKGKVSAAPSPIPVLPKQ